MDVLQLFFQQVFLAVTLRLLAVVNLFLEFKNKNMWY